MSFAQEAVQFECPVQGPGFTDSEIQELLSLLRPPSPGQNSGSSGSNQALYSNDERRRRRKISNRESARKSRWRKKRYLEDLTQQLNRLKMANRELKNRLGSILNQSHVLWRENDRLMLESIALNARLSDLCYVFAAMQKSQQQCSLL